MPHRCVHPLPAIIEPILAAGSAMQVNDDLKPVIASPCDGFLEIWQLTLDVWLTGPNCKSPIADGEADVIQTTPGSFSAKT